MTGSKDLTPSTVVVAVGPNEAESKGHELGRSLAEAFGIALTSVHVEQPGADTDDTEHTPEERLAVAIARGLPTDGILVIESEHADRWRSRHSVAEHTIDAFAGPSVAVGPRAGATFAVGPILVALDGSKPAEASLATAATVAKALGRTIEVVQAVPELLHPESDDSTEPEASAYLSRVAAASETEMAATVVASNDPVSALVDLAVARGASLLALASRGDRTTSRSSMSRTAAGLIAEAPCPVLVVASSADG
jgi:nucleotide-binding universal stress UspA family protein